MIKFHIAACLMATALVAAPAMAQTTMQPAAPPPAGDAAPPLQAQPGMTQPGTTVTQDAPAPATGMTQQPMAPATDLAAQDQPGHDLRLEGGFIAQQSPDHVLATDLIGVNVIGADDASIGSVKDLVMDGQNRLAGVVVGVGGFLGIGEKSVGIPIDALNFVPDVEATATIGTGVPGARDIAEIRVPMTREQLDDAPTFSRLETPGGAMTPPGVAPGTPPDTAPGAQPPAQAN
jgi:hypothetical protein